MPGYRPSAAEQNRLQASERWRQEGPSSRAFLSRSNNARKRGDTEQPVRTSPVPLVNISRQGLPGCVQIFVLGWMRRE